VPHLCGFYPGIRLTAEENARKNVSQRRKTSVKVVKTSVSVVKPVRLVCVCVFRNMFRHMPVPIFRKDIIHRGQVSLQCDISFGKWQYVITNETLHTYKQTIVYKITEDCSSTFSSTKMFLPFAVKNDAPGYSFEKKNLNRRQSIYILLPRGSKFRFHTKEWGS